MTKNGRLEAEREAGREGGRQGGREGVEAGREGGRQGGRERGREGVEGGRKAGSGGRQGGRQGGRESGREAGREGGRQAGREGGKERDIHVVNRPGNPISGSTFMSLHMLYIIYTACSSYHIVVVHMACICMVMQRVMGMESDHIHKATERVERG